MNNDASQHPILSVSELNQLTKEVLESSLGTIQVQGEISNLAMPASGHIYFTLKDDKAQVKVAMFRFSCQRLTFRPENGMQVTVKARVTLYEVRGDYQLVAEHMEPGGEGLLRQQFERLKAKLKAEGLFDTEHKKTLPAVPQTIGVITSPTGAVIRDILHVLARRYPIAKVIIYPSKVQGDAAPSELIEMLQTANAREECDCLILARGGGSLEDLWAFNDEALAREIFASKLPIICAVGHETDVTIADFVADVRAPTPSAAAELVAPNVREWHVVFRQHAERMSLLIASLIQSLQKELNWRATQIKHPKERFELISQRLDEYELRLTQALKSKWLASQNNVKSAAKALMYHSPSDTIRVHQQSIAHYNHQARFVIQQLLNHCKAQFGQNTKLLNAVSPLGVVQRGFAIATSTDGQVVKSIRHTNVGNDIAIRISDGQLTCEVKDIKQQ